MPELPTPDDVAALQSLEESLWREETRFDADWMQSVMAEDFVEYGRSGRQYRRADSLAVTRQAIDATLPLPAFQARLLAPGLAQVTYDSAVVYEGRTEHARRSSIWSRAADGWKLRFHQGTPFEGDASSAAPAGGDMPPERARQVDGVAGPPCVVPTAEEHLPEVYRVLDAVARERRYLAFTQAPPLAQSVAYYRSLLRSGSPYFVALVRGAVVGWCDVTRAPGETRAHIGVLGMGLLPEARGQGLGRRLLQAAIAQSWACGLSRLELTVRDDNLVAKALYEKLGFQVEGLRRQGSLLGAEVHDVWAMALLKP